MKLKFATLAAICVLAVTASANADDKVKIQGTWKVEKQIDGGMEAPAVVIGDLVLEFKGNKLIPRLDGKNEDGEFEFKLDETKKPKVIDYKSLEGKGKAVSGIYEIDGDTMKICSTKDGERPTKFESPEGSKNILITLKRVKK